MTEQEFAVTAIESSKRLEEGHRGECFHFWFSMSVSSPNDFFVKKRRAVKIVFQGPILPLLNLQLQR
jgi:hypothetical protein